MLGTPLNIIALVGDPLGEVDLGSVDDQVHAAEHQQVESRRGDDDVGLELLPGARARAPSR